MTDYAAFFNVYLDPIRKHPETPNPVQFEHVWASDSPSGMQLGIQKALREILSQGGVFVKKRNVNALKMDDAGSIDYRDLEFLPLHLVNKIDWTASILASRSPGIEFFVPSTNEDNQ